MTQKYGDPFSPVYLQEGSPTSHPRTSNMRQIEINADLSSALSTGVMTTVAIALQAGDLVTNISAKSGATAADTPLNWWFALYDNAATPALLAQTADQTTTAWAANTVKTLALATPQLITVPGIYQVGIMMKATACVSLLGHDLGIAGAAASIVSSKALAQTSGSTLTTTAPATVATPSSSRYVPFVVVT